MKRFHTEKKPEILNEIVDIFTPHIEKESELLAENKQDKKDLMQDMYLNLLSILNKDSRKPKIYRETVAKLNKLNEKSKKVESPSFVELTSKEEERLSYREPYDMDETPFDKALKLARSRELFVMRASEVMNKYLDGYSFEEIGESLICKVKAPGAREIFKKSVKKIQKAMNIDTPHS